MKSGIWMRVPIPLASTEQRAVILGAIGIGGSSRSVPIAQLRATQSFVRRRFVNQYLRAREYDDIHVVAIGDDLYVIADGHHRVTAFVAQGFKEIGALVCVPP